MPPHWVPLPLFLLIIAAASQGVLADSAPNQPLLGFAWPNHTIPVLIKSSQPNASQAVLKAMDTWNLAQQWFITTHMGGAGTPFTFNETNSSSDSMITVTFNQTQTEENLGETHWQAFHDKQGFFKQVLVAISIDLTTRSGRALNDSELQVLATHELGHSLGLDHTTFSTTDLMYHVPKVMFPSTLNLYVIHLLSQITNENNLPQQPVTLLSDIPYGVVSQVDLDTATLPTLETATTSSSTQLAQLISTIAYAPWTLLGIFALLAAGVVAFTVRGRKPHTPKRKLEDVKITFKENPVVETQPIHTERVGKKCHYCGAEVPREATICGKCGMPAMYRK